MDQVLIISSLHILLFALIAFALVFLMLRLRDRLIGVNFSTVIEGITHDPQAAAIYYGASFIGACLLFGLVLS